MKELKNIYDYELDKFKTIIINKNGDIIGGSYDTMDARKDQEITLSTKDRIKVLDVKKIIVAEEL